MAVACVEKCVTSLAPGSYRVVVEGTARVRDGAVTMSVDEEGDYLIEGRPRSRTGIGVLIGSLGLPIALVGGGILIGADGFESHLSPRQERWFWVGSGMLAGGIALMPIGFSMASSQPDVWRLEPAARPAPRLAEPFVNVNGRARAPVYRDRAAVPPGYQAIEEPRWGLIKAGALVLGSSYGIIAGIAAGELVGQTSRPSYYSKGFIPILGPLLISREAKGTDATGWTVYGMVPQLTGGLLLFLGAVLPKKALVRMPIHTAVTPWATPNAGGFALSGGW